MLHELFITHCTNGTLIMNPFTFMKASLVILAGWLLNTAGVVCWWLGNLVAALESLAAILSTSVVLAGACTLVDDLHLLVHLVFQFLLLTPFGVSAICEWEVSALERTFPGLDLLLVWGSCSLTGWVGRNCGSTLAWASFLLYTCLVCGEALTASLFAGSLVAGKVLLSCLFYSDKAELSPSEKETDTLLLLCCGFTYPCPVGVWM